MKNLTIYLFLISLTYFFYVYPYDVLIHLVYGEEVFDVYSLLTTFIFFLIIIYYLKSRNTNFLLKIFVYEGMGIGFISFWISNIFFIMNNFLLIPSYINGLGCFCLIFTITLIGFLNARKIKVKKILIKTSKFANSKKIIFFSDTHLGTNTSKHLKKIYSKIKKLEFDFLVIGGDLIDSSSFSLEGLQILKKIKKPIFFISGNHEYYIKDSKKKLYNLKYYNLTFLNNISKKIGNINLIGISDDKEPIYQKEIVTKLYKKGLFNLVVVHKPSIWSSVYEQADLMLSGHTHNGQIFPFNFIVKLKFKNIYGMYKKDNSRLYVSSGSACWGPKIRLGSKNEIVQFVIN